MKKTPLRLAPSMVIVESTGEKGLFSLAPPHQGIDGEWTDRSGVIVYKWNEKSNRPNTGSANWKKRWSCCSEYDENAPPCRHGWHSWGIHKMSKQFVLTTGDSNQAMSSNTINLILIIQLPILVLLLLRRDPVSELAVGSVRSLLDLGDEPLLPPLGYVIHVLGRVPLARIAAVSAVACCSCRRPYIEYGDTVSASDGGAGDSSMEAAAAAVKATDNGGDGGGEGDGLWCLTVKKAEDEKMVAMGIVVVDKYMSASHQNGCLIKQNDQQKKYKHTAIAARDTAKEDTNIAVETGNAKEAPVSASGAASGEGEGAMSSWATAEIAMEKTKTAMAKMIANAFDCAIAGFGAKE
ncbi:LOW QUALITY PROTEIN: hypothetical protein V2J09_023285 [Rumex salicifolius]